MQVAGQFHPIPLSFSTSSLKYDEICQTFFLTRIIMPYRVLGFNHSSDLQWLNIVEQSSDSDNPVVYKSFWMILPILSSLSMKRRRCIHLIANAVQMKRVGWSSYCEGRGSDEWYADGNSRQALNQIFCLVDPIGLVVGSSLSFKTCYSVHIIIFSG
jgi:hypothetical protein